MPSIWAARYYAVRCSVLALPETWLLCCASMSSICRTFYQSAGGSLFAAEISLAQILRCAYSWNQTKHFCECNTAYLTASELTAVLADWWNADGFLFCSYFCALVTNVYNFSSTYEFWQTSHLMLSMDGRNILQFFLSHFFLALFEMNAEMDLKLLLCHATTKLKLNWND